jgi:hypothetical protein
MLHAFAVITLSGDYTPEIPLLPHLLVLLSLQLGVTLLIHRRLRR